MTMTGNGYFSDVECAGGCGNRLPQHLVDRGRRYLYGHKGGCPAEGEPLRHKRATPPVRGVALGAAMHRPAEAQHTSYERTLGMVEENIAATRSALVGFYAERERVEKQCSASEESLRRLFRLEDGLRAVLGKPPADHDDAPELEFGDNALEAAQEGQVQ